MLRLIVLNTRKRIISGWNIFGIKSHTPSSKHLFSVSKSFSVVATTIGMFRMDSLFLNSSIKANPSITGMMISRITRTISSLYFSKLSRPLSPFSASMILYLSFKISASVPLFNLLSSTIKIVFFICYTSFILFLLYSRQHTFLNYFTKICANLQKITPVNVLIAVASIAGPMISAGFTLPYWLR